MEESCNEERSYGILSESKEISFSPNSPISISLQVSPFYWHKLSKPTWESGHMMLDTDRIHE